MAFVDVTAEQSFGALQIFFQYAFANIPSQYGQDRQVENTKVHSNRSHARSYNIHEFDYDKSADEQKKENPDRSNQADSSTRPLSDGIRRLKWIFRCHRQTAVLID